MIKKKAQLPPIVVAYKEFKKLGIHKFPINIFDVYKHYHIPLVSYSEASENGDFLETINGLREKQVDAFCYKSDKSYIVFYDNMAYSNRIPFTLAHELGHILLRHHYCSDNGIITRYATLTRKDWREKSADAFAGAFIRPAMLIKILNIKEIHDTTSIFGVSVQCAEVGNNIAKSFTPLSRFTKVVSYFNNQFHDFIHGRYCMKCHHTFAIEKSKYCPVCGSDKLIWNNRNLPIFSFLENPLEGELPLDMKYHSYPEQENGKTQKCFRCDNEEIGDDDYCIICGLETQNKCSSYSCNETLSLNARYCPYCGEESIYYRLKLLPSWEDEYKEIQSELDSAQQFAAGSEDIPF